MVHTFPAPVPSPTPPAAPPPAGPPAGPPPRDRRTSRTTIGLVAGAALLSSALTAGVVSLVDRDEAASPASAPIGATGSVSPGPAAPVGSSANGPSTTWAAVAASVRNSVVAVRLADGQGSGVVLDTKGHVLTNNHVIADAGSGGVKVTLSDGRTYPATVAGTDPTTDLAVLALRNPPSGLTPATLGDSSAVKVGDAVMAIGNPLGLSDTATTGIVSAVNRPVSTSAGSGQGDGSQDPFSPPSRAASATAVVTNAIQTDAAINPGNSGGALLDASGRVIGITSSIASTGRTAGNIGLGFAIPINEAKPIAQQLIASGKAQHAYLGIAVQDGTATTDGAERQAAVVGQVSSGTPAAGAGLRTGDAIVAIDGQPVGGAESLIGTVRARQPGATVTLTVVRDGTSRQVSLTLGTAPTSS